MNAKNDLRARTAKTRNQVAKAFGVPIEALEHWEKKGCKALGKKAYDENGGFYNVLEIDEWVVATLRTDRGFFEAVKQSLLGKFAIGSAAGSGLLGGLAWNFTESAVSKTGENLGDRILPPPSAVSTDDQVDDTKKSKEQSPWQAVFKDLGMELEDASKRRMAELKEASSDFLKWTRMPIDDQIFEAVHADWKELMESARSDLLRVEQATRFLSEINLAREQAGKPWIEFDKVLEHISNRRSPITEVEVSTLSDWRSSPLSTFLQPDS